MTTRTPEQKLARKIQAATGRKYCDCLTEARRQLMCSERFPSREPNNSDRAT